MLPEHGTTIYPHFLPPLDLEDLRRTIYDINSTSLIEGAERATSELAGPPDVKEREVQASPTRAAKTIPVLSTRPCLLDYR